MNVCSRKKNNLLSQVSFSCQPGLTEGVNVDCVPDKGGTFMRSICIVPVNKRVDIPRGDVQRYFLLFLFRPHWERSPPTEVSQPGWSRAGNVWGTFFYPALHAAGVSSAVLERAALTFRWVLNITSSPVSKERLYSLSRLCAGLRLRLPVYLHLLLRRSLVATGLEVIRLTDELRLTLFKVN